MSVSLLISDLSISVKDDDMAAIRIRGLPFKVTFEEIEEFFQDFKFIEKSAILGVLNDGRKNGYGAILFENSEEATAATNELDRKNIGNRWVELSVMSYHDYINFNSRT